MARIVEGSQGARGDGGAGVGKNSQNRGERKGDAFGCRPFSSLLGDQEPILIELPHPPWSPTHFFLGKNATVQTPRPACQNTDRRWAKPTSLRDRESTLHLSPCGLRTPRQRHSSHSNPSPQQHPRPPERPQPQCCSDGGSASAEDTAGRWGPSFR